MQAGAARWVGWVVLTVGSAEVMQEIVRSGV